LDSDALTRNKQDATLVWLKLLKDAVTDGEQFRIYFVHGFLEQKEKNSGWRD